MKLDMFLTQRQRYILQSTLAELRPEFPDCIIAGGCLRDMLHGYEPKDIDVFTFYSIPEAERLFSSDTKGDKDLAYDTTGARILGCSKYRPGYAYPLQIIELNEQVVDMKWRNDNGPNDDGNYSSPLIYVAVSQFILGLSQLYFDHEGLTAYRTYSVDAEGGFMTVTWCSSVHEFERILNKWYSLLDRYPRYTLRVPREFGWCIPSEGLLTRWLAGHSCACTRPIDDPTILIIGRLD